MKLLKISFIYSLLFVALITVSQAVGATQISPILALFTNADGTPCQMPCLFGITVNDVDPVVIKGKLKIHDLTQVLVLWENGSLEANRIDQYIGKNIRVYMRILNNQVRSVVVFPYLWDDGMMETVSPLMPLILSSNGGSFVAYLGNSSEVQFVNKSNEICYYLNYYQAQLILGFSASSYKVSIQDSLCSITLNLVGEYHLGGSFADWKGFTNHDFH